jgi:acyl-coenzyme A thioesterase PaaI-like protein
MLTEDPFLEFACSNVVEADARHAVAQQRPAPELDNHAGVRHAGALFAVGYAASQALVAAALESKAESAKAQMVPLRVGHSSPQGLLTAVGAAYALGAPVRTERLESGLR